MVIPNSASSEVVRPEDVQATFCDVLVDEWINQGVRYAAIAPGSRSTPLALALMKAQESTSSLTVDVFHDERSAAFSALGSAMASGLPAIVLCTSGTAAAHLHAAVIEADLSEVPMIVCTADRPPELRDVGAPQTIDQTKMFGDAVRWFHDPGVPFDGVAASWRSLAVRSFWLSAGSRPGPVHLNLPFREPLVGRSVRSLFDASGASGSERTRERRRGRIILAPDDLDQLVEDLRGRRGVIIAGRGAGDPASIETLARAVGWPVFAEPRAGCGAGSRTILHFDALLRVPEVATSLRPDVVLRLGESPASKVLAQWVTNGSCREIHVDNSSRIRDPNHHLAVRIEADPDQLLAQLADRLDLISVDTWWEKWLTADRTVRSVLDDIDRADDPWSGLSASRAVMRMIPRDSHLVVSSSMPIRDVEWFAGDTSHVTVHANRGANGIDGVIATALGVARSSDRPTYVLLGDVAAIHDASTLLSLASRDVDVRIVVINNDGGGIFHHLPQASTVDERTFEAIYGTPHGLSFADLAAALGLERTSSDRSSDEVRAALNNRGPSLIEIRTDRHRDVEAHQYFHARVAEKIRHSP
ncbi:MAG: 2-succinyl-5-enolpyruvyl-6-hydroxy-3-cyclohexene-carboxylic-acid synthase [Actinomycetota bacterium]